MMGRQLTVLDMSEAEELREGHVIITIKDQSGVGAVRSCGTCSLCCTAMGVKELRKPRNVKCNHLTVLGRCSIYEHRPDSCREFKCLWLRGILPLELQPSRVRAVGDVNAAGDMVIFHVAPADVGADRRGALRDWIEFVVQTGVIVVVVIGDTRVVYGKDDKDVEIIAESVDGEKQVLKSRDRPK